MNRSNEFEPFCKQFILLQVKATASRSQRTAKPTATKGRVCEGFKHDLCNMTKVL